MQSFLRYWLVDQSCTIVLKCLWDCCRESQATARQKRKTAAFPEAELLALRWQLGQNSKCEALYSAVLRAGTPTDTTAVVANAKDSEVGIQLVATVAVESNKSWSSITRDPRISVDHNWLLQIAALPIDAIEALLGSLGNKPEACGNLRTGIFCCLFGWNPLQVGWQDPAPIALVKHMDACVGNPDFRTSGSLCSSCFSQQAKSGNRWIRWKLGPSWRSVSQVKVMAAVPGSLEKKASSDPLWQLSHLYNLVVPLRVSCVSFVALYIIILYMDFWSFLPWVSFRLMAGRSAEQEPQRVWGCCVSCVVAADRGWTEVTSWDFSTWCWSFIQSLWRTRAFKDPWFFHENNGPDTSIHDRLCANRLPLLNFNLKGTARSQEICMGSTTRYLSTHMKNLSQPSNLASFVLRPNRGLPPSAFWLWRSCARLGLWNFVVSFFVPVPFVAAEVVPGGCTANPDEGRWQHWHQGTGREPRRLAERWARDFCEALGLLCSTAPFHIMALAMAGEGKAGSWVTCSHQIIASWIWMVPNGSLQAWVTRGRAMMLKLACATQSIQNKGHRSTTFWFVTCQMAMCQGELYRASVPCHPRSFASRARGLGLCRSLVGRPWLLHMFTSLHLTGTLLQFLSLEDWLLLRPTGSNNMEHCSLSACPTMIAIAKAFSDSSPKGSTFFLKNFKSPWCWLIHLLPCFSHVPWGTSWNLLKLVPSGGRYWLTQTLHDGHMLYRSVRSKAVAETILATVSKACSAAARLVLVSLAGSQSMVVPRPYQAGPWMMSPSFSLIWPRWGLVGYFFSWFSSTQVKVAESPEMAELYSRAAEAGNFVNWGSEHIRCWFGLVNPAFHPFPSVSILFPYQKSTGTQEDLYKHHPAPGCFCQPF